MVVDLASPEFLCTDWSNPDGRCITSDKANMRALGLWKRYFPSKEFKIVEVSINLTLRIKHTLILKFLLWI